MKIHPLIPLLLILFSTSIHAQTDSLKTKKMNYGAFFTPGYNNRILKATSNESDFTDQRNSEEVGNFRFSAGIIVERKINQKWSIISGLAFSDRGYKTKSESLYWSSPNLGFPTEAYSSFHYKYIDLSLGAKYNIILNQKLSVFLAGGINLSYYLSYSQNNHVKVNGKWDVDKDQLSFLGNDVVNFFPFIQPGIAYRISEKISLSASVNAQIAVKGTNSNLPTKEYLYSIGPSISLIWDR